MPLTPKCHSYVLSVLYRSEQFTLLVLYQLIASLFHVQLLSFNVATVLIYVDKEIYKHRKFQPVVGWTHMYNRVRGTYSHNASRPRPQDAPVAKQPLKNLQKTRRPSNLLIAHERYKLDGSLYLWRVEGSVGPQNYSERSDAAEKWSSLFCFAIQMYCSKGLEVGAIWN